MTVLTQRVPAGHYRFRHVARMEWIKLRTLRSTWWTLVITAAGGAVMAVAIGLNTISKNADLTNNVLAGVVPGLLLIGVLGVLVMTSEYTSGLIRATPAAAIAVLVAGVYLIGPIIGAAAHALAAYLPIFIIGNSLTTTGPELCTGAGQCPHFLPAWAGLGVLSLYAAVALAVGCWLLVRRDA